jgi:hypothetical protein
VIALAGGLRTSFALSGEIYGGVLRKQTQIRDGIEYFYEMRCGAFSDLLGEREEAARKRPG